MTDHRSSGARCSRLRLEPSRSPERARADRRWERSAPVIPAKVTTPGSRNAPTGPAPRLPNGRPDFNGVWDHAYVPDMSLSAKNPTQQKARDRCRSRRAGIENIKSYDPEKDGDYTGHVHALRADALLQRSVPDPDHADRQARRVSVRDGHLVPRRAVQGRPFCRSEPDVVRRIDREVGRRHAGRRHGRLQWLEPAGHPWASAQRQAARRRRRSGATTPATWPTR